MKRDPREEHLAHQDARNELAAQSRQEARLRSREHDRVVNPLVQEPARGFETPIPHRYEPAAWVDQMDAPGSIGTDFEGCVV